MRSQDASSAARLRKFGKVPPHERNVWFFMHYGDRLVAIQQAQARKKARRSRQDVTAQKERGLPARQTLRIGSSPIYS